MAIDVRPLDSLSTTAASSKGQAELEMRHDSLATNRPSSSSTICNRSSIAAWRQTSKASCRGRSNSQI